MKHLPVVALLSMALALPASSGAGESVDALIPRLAATNVTDRYSAQMEVQAAALDAARPGAEPQRVAFARTIASRAADPQIPQPARVWLVRQLEYIGHAESLPALESLLRSSDPELRECARRSLEKNSAQGAGEILRAALSTENDLIFTLGLINSLGERQDCQAVPALSSRLARPELAAAVISALGKIACPEATAALWDFYRQKQSAVGQALLESAGGYLREGQKKPAAEICLRLFTTCDDVRIKSAALVGLAQASPGEARPQLRRALSDTNQPMQVAAITAGSIAYGKSAARQFADLLPESSPSARLLLLREVDRSAEKVVLTLAASTEPGLSLAALETLGRIGSRDSVPLLVKTAASGSGPASTVASQALSSLPGKGVDAALLELVSRSDREVRATAIHALGLRYHTPALPALLACAREKDSLISEAACSAVARIGADAQIEPLARLALEGATPAQTALGTVVARATDKAAAADTLLALARTAPASRAALLFDPIALTGGKQAMDGLLVFSNNSNPELQDAAIRALAGWPEFDAVEPLLKIASAPEVRKVHNVLVLQGVARLVRSSDSEPAAARLDAALRALKAAQRPEEQKGAVLSIGSINDPRAAQELKLLLADERLKEPAAQAAVTLCGTLKRGQRQAARDLVEAVKAANVSGEISQRAEQAMK